VARSAYGAVGGTHSRLTSGSSEELGFAQDIRGPMAKQHHRAVLNSRLSAVDHRNLVEWWSGGVVVVELSSVLGYAFGIPWLGWLTALLAVLTAYIRVFGGALGFAQDFRGPMAKQQRMAVFTAGCLLVLSSIVTRILWIRLVKEQAEPKVVATIANLAARVKAWLEMEGKEVGAMPGIEQQKNPRHILSRCARVREALVFRARNARRERRSAFTRVRRVAVRAAGGKAEQMRQRLKRGAIRDNRAAGMRRNAEG
jgi:hypothetical protein